MAEAITNHLLGDRWQAVSAGTKPTGYVHPIANQVLTEAGIEHQGRSKSVDEFKEMKFDLVVTVCDSASEECPIWLGQGIREHISFPDPAEAKGDEEQILKVFRKVRDDIADKIPALLQLFEPNQS
jgi:arsenate reductase